MRFRDQVALTLPSFVLRLMLAVTFIWAGLGKIIETTHLEPDQAARLATIGVPVAAAPAPAGTPAPEPAKPEVRLPEPPDAQSAPETGEPTTEDTTPADQDKPSAPGAQLPDPDDEDSAALLAPTAGYRPVAFTQDGATRSLNDRQPPVEPTMPPADKPAAEKPAAGDPPVVQEPTPEPVPAATELAPTPAFTGADFPNGANVRMLAMLALAIDGAANPPLDAESNQPEPFWPQALAKKPWPYALAWAVTLTELIGGVLLLVGLFTRLSALGISGVMLGAMWLTQIGPAIQSGHTILGFLPDYPRFDPGWMTLMWQFSLFAASFAVFLLGSGAIGIDRALFRGSRYHAYDTGPTYTPAGEFDRAPREPKP